MSNRKEDKEVWGTRTLAQQCNRVIVEKGLWWKYNKNQLRTLLKEECLDSCPTSERFKTKEEFFNAAFEEFYNELDAFKDSHEESAAKGYDLFGEFRRVFPNLESVSESTSRNEHEQQARFTVRVNRTTSNLADDNNPFSFHLIPNNEVVLQDKKYDYPRSSAALMDWARSGCTMPLDADTMKIFNTICRQFFAKMERLQWRTKQIKGNMSWVGPIEYWRTYLYGWLHNAERYYNKMIRVGFPKDPMIVKKLIDENFKVEKTITAGLPDGYDPSLHLAKKIVETYWDASNINFERKLNDWRASVLRDASRSDGWKAFIVSPKSLEENTEDRFEKSEPQDDIIAEACRKNDAMWSEMPDENAVLDKLCMLVQGDIEVRKFVEDFYKFRVSFRYRIRDSVSALTLITEENVEKWAFALYTRPDSGEEYAKVKYAMKDFESGKIPSNMMKSLNAFRRRHNITEEKIDPVEISEKIGNLIKRIEEQSESKNAEKVDENREDNEEVSKPNHSSEGCEWYDSITNGEDKPKKENAVATSEVNGVKEKDVVMHRDDVIHSEDSCTGNQKKSGAVKIGFRKGDLMFETDDSFKCAFLLGGTIENIEECFDSVMFRKMSGINGRFLESPRFLTGIIASALEQYEKTLDNLMKNDPKGFFDEVGKVVEYGKELQ